MEYPKIETLYDRDDATGKVQLDKVRLPEFLMVKEYLITEKVDGTNVRVELFPESGGLDGFTPARVEHKGRTDRAQMPTNLYSHLARTFTVEKMVAAFDPGTRVTLYGEGYGPGIQKGGGLYRKDVGFRLFDVVVHAADFAWWLDWVDVENVAAKLGIKTVPVIGRHPTDLLVGDKVAVQMANEDSIVARVENGVAMPGEGIVARTQPLLFMRNGKRLMWKLKARDF